MQVIGFVVVDWMYFSHDEVSFLHDFSHVELILFILLPLLGNVGGVQWEVCECACLDVYLPSLVGNLHWLGVTSCTRPTTMSPTWGLYFALRGLTIMSLFVISTVPRTDAWILLSMRYVPWPLNGGVGTSWSLLRRWWGLRGRPGSSCLRQSCSGWHLFELLFFAISSTNLVLL